MPEDVNMPTEKKTFLVAQARQAIDNINIEHNLRQDWQRHV
jgi:hypothetical protein